MALLCVVVCGCLQDTARMDDDALFASTPSLVTMRILVAMSFVRNWGVKVCDASPAFLRAMIAEDIHVLPPVEFYPNSCIH